MKKDKQINARVNSEEWQKLINAGWTTQKIVDWAFTELLERKIKVLKKPIKKLKAH